jgi:glutamine synthetase
MLTVDIRKFIQDENIEFIDVRYTSLEGRLRSINFPVKQLDYFIEKGIGVDGSSLGLMDEKNSDMVIKPDLTHYYPDPFSPIPTLILFGKLFLTKGRGYFDGDPRRILEKTVSILKEEDIADEILTLPELEFYVFDGCNYQNSPLFSTIDIQTREGYPGCNGYHADYPLDLQKDFRSHLMAVFGEVGIGVKYGHHEVGSFSQSEIELLSSDPVTTAENVLLGKYIVQRVANSYNLVATFMPKPIYGEPGSGLHFHLLLKKNGSSIFYDEKDKEHLSYDLKSFAKGILKHGKAISSFTNPTTNSYKRLTSGFESPRKLSYSVGGRESAIRIPDYFEGGDIDIEYRPPDATCNPYLALSVILLSGLDGVKTSMGKKEQKGTLEELPCNLLEATNALMKDKDFLTRDGIFPEWILDRWCDAKRKEFWDIESRPSAIEFIRYFSL